MRNDPELRGLERLIAVLDAENSASIPSYMGLATNVELAPAHGALPKAGHLVGGQPLDPVLAAFYQRYDRVRLGDLLIISEQELADINRRTRDALEPQVKRLFIYAKFWGFAYHLATVPELADPSGLQPVVYFDAYDEKFIFPIASNVDRAFALYAHYAQALQKANGSFWVSEGPGEDILFPFSLKGQIARDEELVDLIAKGRFDDVVMPDEETRQMLDQVLRAAGVSR